MNKVSYKRKSYSNSFSLHRSLTSELSSSPAPQPRTLTSSGGHVHLPTLHFPQPTLLPLNLSQQTLAPRYLRPAHPNLFLLLADVPSHVVRQTPASQWEIAASSPCPVDSTSVDRDKGDPLRAKLRAPKLQTPSAATSASRGP